MAEEYILARPAPITIDAGEADKLLNLGSGDAALLFLYILRNAGRFDPERAAKELIRVRDFWRAHTSSKERANFLRNMYGTGGYSSGVSNAFNSWMFYESKGMTLKKGACADVQLSWNAVASRVDALMAAGRYLSDEEIERYQRKRQEREQSRAAQTPDTEKPDTEKPSDRQKPIPETPEKVPTSVPRQPDASPARFDSPS